MLTGCLRQAWLLLLWISEADSGAAKGVGATDAFDHTLTPAHSQSNQLVQASTLAFALPEDLNRREHGSLHLRRHRALCHVDQNDRSVAPTSL